MDKDKLQRLLQGGTREHQNIDENWEAGDRTFKTYYKGERESIKTFNIDVKWEAGAGWREDFQDFQRNIRKYK